MLPSPVSSGQCERPLNPQSLLLLLGSGKRQPVSLSLAGVKINSTPLSCPSPTRRQRSSASQNSSHLTPLVVDVNNHSIVLPSPTSLTCECEQPLSISNHIGRYEEPKDISNHSGVCKKPLSIFSHGGRCEKAQNVTLHIQCLGWSPTFNTPFTISVTRMNNCQSNPPPPSAPPPLSQTAPSHPPPKKKKKRKW